MAETPQMKVEAEVRVGKPGVRTSEFWTTIATKVVGLLVTAYGAWKGSDAIMGLGGIILAVAAGTYNVSRGQAKRVS